jgi:hypothetical protein
MDIVHRNNILLTDADYWSRLGVDICYVPLFKSCLDFDRGLREKFPEPIKLPLFPENMLHYRGPHVIPPSDTAKPVNDVHHCKSLQPPSQRLTAMAFPKFGDIGTLAPSDGHASTNHKFTCYSQQVLHHSWAVYSVGGGHFASTISSRCLTFCVKLAWDQCDFVAPSSENSQHARGSSKMEKISSITSISLAIVLKYTVTSSILFAIGIVTQLHIVGNSRCSSSLNFKQFAPFKWPQLSFSLTITDASNHSQPTSNQLAGVYPQPTPPSRPMATLSQARALSSLSSILCVHRRSNRFI